MSTLLKDRFTVVPAVYILFKDGEKILLLKRANTSYFDGSYSIPAGHIDGSEPAIVAAIREAKEEVGATLERSELKLVHVMHRLSDIPSIHERIDLYFETGKQHPEITNREPEKCDELRWCSVKELPENMVPEVRIALQKVAANEAYSDYNFSQE
jgi:8-oxo-dGTP pyrophosphatase MutT (NUDIX family)